MVSESLDGLTGNLSLLTDHDHVELETTLQELVLNLLGDSVETDVGRRANFFIINCCHDSQMSGIVEVGRQEVVNDDGRCCEEKASSEGKLDSTKLDLGFATLENASCLFRQLYKHTTYNSYGGKCFLFFYGI